MRAGADAVGVNFYPGSRRCVTRERAAEILEAIRGRALPVAVTVNAPPGETLSLCRALGIETVQLSGEEPPETARRLPLRRIKVLHLGNPSRIPEFRGYPCEALLLDARIPGRFGGTGRTLDWDRLGRICGGPFLADPAAPRAERGIPWILAGGLTPENVGEAARKAMPHGVDVASGVEDGRGRKDPRKIAAFVRNAREGLGL